MFNFFKNKEEEQIINIHKHNFDQFVNSLCNLKSLEKEYNQCLDFLKENAFQKPIEELIVKENNCLKLQSEYESCSILHAQLTTIFNNRQKKFLSDLKEKKTNVKF